jgi:2-C-methyl-D-erythritol 4-phosphate cytidylyltransferase
MPARLVGLIPAAGQGARFGGETPKQYLEIGGWPLLAHTLRGLLAFERVERAFVVLSPDDERFSNYDWSAFGAHLAERVAPLWCGGATRRDSVLNGLVAMSNVVDPDDWVLVHDAARPCLRREDVARLVAAVESGGDGGILAVPLADTLKRADAEGRIARTEPREGLWLAQTPQMFRVGTLMHALGAAGAVTDEASAIEAIGLRPRLVQGSPRNVKVTYPGDVAIAAAFLGAGA